MTLTKSQDNSQEFNTFKLAIAVLAERVSSLPEADKNDLFELTKIVFSASSEEEKQSAMRAMDEIMEQRPLPLIKVDEPESVNDKLGGWLAFISGRIREARTAAGMT